MDHQGLTVWLTGLSSAGKTTLGRALHQELLARACHVEWLDGDEIRQHLSKDLGFGTADRNENIRRITYVAKLLTRNGIIVIVSAISPYRAGRDEARARIGAFLEVYVNAPLEVCERRDGKGLYRKARNGEIQGFTGIHDPYEPPVSAEVECHTDQETIPESLSRVLAAIERHFGWPPRAPKDRPDCEARGDSAANSPK